MDIIRSQNSFLDTCVLLDLETGKDNRLWHIGAIRSKEIFELKKISDINKALAELDRFVNGAAFILGHNILHHDLPILASLCPDLRLLRLPVVDTLYLSPLAFPQNPYHRLVKDYKLVRDSINNPVADAGLAGNIFKDQWENIKDINEQFGRIPPQAVELEEAVLGAILLEQGTEIEVLDILHPESFYKEIGILHIGIKVVYTFLRSYCHKMPLDFNSR